MKNTFNTINKGLRLNFYNTSTKLKSTILSLMLVFAVLGIKAQTVTIQNASASGCYYYSGASKTTITVQVGWTGASNGNTITVTLDGTSTRIIKPQSNYDPGSGSTVAGPIVSPQVVAFEINADGNPHSLVAVLSNGASATSGTVSVNAPVACAPMSCTGTNLGGMTYFDNNANGVHDAGEIKGIPNVTIKAFDKNGTLYTATSDDDGKYAFSTAKSNAILPANYPVRLEFTNWPGLVQGYAGPSLSGNASNVRFVNAAACNIDCGGVNPLSYSQAAPPVFSNLYTNGNPLGGGSAGTTKAIIQHAYNNYTDRDVTTIATSAQVGSVWAHAWNKYKKRLFSAAFLKRHVGLGPLGLGGIYTVDYSNPASPVLSNFLNVSTIGINVGTIGTNTARGLGANRLDPNADATAFALVGKAGIGGMDLSDDGNTLYFMNLHDKKVYAIDITNYLATGTIPTASNVTSFTVPDPGCTNGSYRPFAVKVFENKLYAGIVCDASSGTKSNLTASIKALDLATNVWSDVFNFPLTYPKGYPSAGEPQITGWYPWTDNISVPFNANDLILWPTPVLTDIEFDLDGAMTIALMDRIGHQMGNYNWDNAAYNDGGQTDAGGDVLRAFYSNGAYVLENNAKAGPTTGYAPGNNQGPGFGEFYHDDFDNVGGYHTEMATGGLTVIPGSGEIMIGMVDPSVFRGGDIWANGVRVNSSLTGQQIKGKSYYSDAGIASFGKANGMGDVEIASDNINFLEVGNYVWRDLDVDGIQDPAEKGIAGVVMRMYKTSDGSQVGTATTDANGNYYFSTLNGQTILPNTNYRILAGVGQFNITDTTLTSNGVKYKITLTNTGQGANPTINDNNFSILNLSTALGSIPAGIPFINITTGVTGYVDHSIDLGLYALPGLGDTVWNDLNKNGLQDVGETPFQNLKVYLLNASGTKIDSTTTNSVGYYQFINLQPGIYYQVEFTSPGVIFGPTLQNVGSDDNDDSDIDALLKTQQVILTWNEFNKTLDAGFFACTTPNAGSNLTACGGSCLNLTGTTPNTGIWTASGSNPTGATLGSTTSGVANVCFTNVSTGTYTFKYSTGGCFDEMDVVVSAKPNAGANQSVCINTTATLAASGSGTWSAQTGNPASATITNTSSPTSTVTGLSVVGNYNFIWTNGSCKDTMTVVVNPLPTVSAGSPFTKTCVANTSGAAIGEANVAGNTYSWSPATGLSSTTVSNPTANPSATTTYTVVKTNTATGCTATASVTVTVNNAAITVSAGSPFTKTCTANTSGAAIGEANDATATYAWSPATGLSSTNVSNPTANPSATTTYTVVKTNTATGCTATASVTVTVNNSAITVSAGSPFTKTCVANTSGAAIGEANVAGNTYSWSPATGLSSTTVSNPTANPSATTTYTVVKTNTTTGCTATAQVTVTVNNSAITVSAGSPFTKTCTANTSGATIGEANDATATYSWSPATGLSSTTVSNPTANPSATTTYTVVKTNTTTGCTATAQVTVTVNNSAITVSAGSPFTKTCTANTSGAAIGEANDATATYAWSPATGLSSTTVSNPTANPSATTTYTVVKTNTATGCTATASVTVTVNTTLPIVSAGASVCVGSNMNITPNTGGTWTSSNNTVATVSNTGFVNGVNAGNVTFTFTNNSNGCSATTTSVAVNANTSSTTTANICLTDMPYVWNGNTYNTAGTYLVNLTNSKGCDSAATLVLNVINATVGNYVWSDLNNNGIQDEPASAGLNGVTVELWNATTNTIVASTVTVNDGSGNPGYYSFNICTNGNYKVKFPTSNNGNGLTIQTPTAGTDGNNDADAATGFSPVFTINTNGTGVAKNNPTIDAGYFVCVKPNAGVDQVVCAASCTNLVGTNLSNGTWTALASNPAGATLGTTTAGIANVCFTTPLNCSFKFIYTVSGGCSDTMTVTVNPLPIQPTCSPITKCIGLNATNAVLAAVTPAGGTITWNTGNAATATGYTYTITNSCGSASCSSSITRVNVTPITGSIITICIGVDATSAVLAGVTPAGGTITWNTGNATTATGYTYTVTSGCGAQNFTSVITRIPLPTTPTCSPITVCVGSNATADVTAAVSPAGGVVTWNTGNATTATSYTYTVSNSCGSASCTNTITRNNPNVAHTAAVTVCAGVDATSAVLPFVSPAGGTITWNTGNASTATSYTYTVPCVCGTQSSTSAITRTALPSVPTCGVVSITEGVNATAAVMAAVSPAGGVITWNTGNATSATSYTYTVSNSCGSASCACTITRTPLCVKPTFSSTVPSYTICAGQPITINVTNAGTLSGSGSSLSLYANNFNSSIGSNWTFPATSPANVPSILSYNGENMLGALQGQKAEFNIAGLPSHNSVKIDFDLYIFDTWDGNDIWVGEDKWKMDVDNTNIINTTFSNFNYRTQAYPGNIPAINPNGSGSIANNLPAICNLGGGAFTSKYHISKTIPHTANALKVVLEGLGLEELCNESWAFDNFNIEYSTTGVTSNVIWTNPPVSSNTISNNASITVSPSSSTYYVADMNGCKDTVRVTVIPTPVTPVCGTVTLCQGLDATSAVLAVVSPAGGVITWNTSSATTATSYTYTVSNSNCTANTNGTINRLSLPATPTCAPVTIGTGVNATAAVMAAVSPAGGVITWNTGNASTATSYTYTVSNSCGTATCACTITRTVDCVKPTFSSTIPSYTICAGQPITINVTNATSTVGAVGSFNAAYSNNFNTSVDGNWTFPATSPANVPSILSYNGESMLGALQGQKAEFNMAGLPAHDSIKVDFDLYLFDTWDGNDTWVGIDRWKMDVDNNSVINTTFSNFSYRTQAYPGNIPAVNPNGTGSIANNLPARCNLGGGAFTSKYHISRTVAHSAASIKVVLEGLGLEELCNESWAFDNFSLQYSGSGSVTTNVTWTNPPVSANTISSSTSITVNPTTSTYYVANMNGCKDTVRVTVLPNPTAPNTAPLIVCNGLDATAAILLATSPQGGVITFNTGNGATATSYTYTITNANNCSASSTNTITRTNSTIAIACAPLTLAAGIDATAAVTAAVSPAGGVIIWNTGNPSTATSYTYSLVACGCGGSSCSNIITRTGISTGTGNASFNTLVSGNCNNYITTTNTSTGTGNTYLWNFGDGSTSNEVSPSHYYIDGGVKTITLTVTNGSSVTTASNDVNISANTGMNGRVGMTVAISPSTTQVLLGNSFAFTPTYTNNSNNSPGLYCAGTPNWTFGDGTSSTGTVIFSKSYAAAGSYTARIIQQTTNTGCFSEVSKVITVTPNPLFAVNNNTPISYKNNYTLNEKNNSLTNVKVATVAIDLYPNPNYGTFKIDLTNTNINNADVIIYDIFGKEVYRNNFNVSNSNIIDIANLDIATGNYNLVISSNGETKARKQFVKIIE